MYILSPLYSALIAIGTFIRIDIGVYPITLQTLFCFLALLTLRPKEAVLSTLIYLFMGLIGIPVFTAGGSIAAFLAPSGGFLIGMPFSVLIGSLIVSKKGHKALWALLALLSSEIVLYLFGILYLKFTSGMSLYRSFIVGALPYLTGDAIKIGVSLLVYKPIWSQIERIRKRRVSISE